MKANILIIEDNYYGFYTTKQVLEGQLKLNVKVLALADYEEIVKAAQRFKMNNVMFRPAGGVPEMVEQIKKKHLNRLNSEVTLLVIPESECGIQLLISAMLQAQAQASAVREKETLTLAA